MRVALTKDFLYNEYIENRKSTNTIANEVDCAHSTIRNWLKKFRIPIRNSSDSHKNQRSSIRTEFKKGQKPWNFKGNILRRGYISVFMPEHPFCNKQGYIREHRLIVEKVIGRYLTLKEKIHHINGIKTDNNVSNLMAFINESAHQRFHHDTKSVSNKEIIFNKGGY